MSTALLDLNGVTKSFYGVNVLRSVDLQLHSGSVLGLVGENGAGKSTLMNIVGGNLRADSGQMQVAGQTYSPRTPRDAQAAGIAFIHQELNLFPNLSIAENVFLTCFPRSWLGTLDRRTMLRHTARLLEQVGLPLHPQQLVENLSAGERQLVEIAKALQLKPRLMILDEPTTSLTIRESERLFELLQTLRASGMGLLYISHALADIQRLCHDVVVLRDGAVVGAGPIADFNNRRLVSLMVGRESDNPFPPRTSRPDHQQVQLDVCQVTQPGVVHEISFALHRGEVLGISGLMGSGRTELARMLFGIDSLKTGSITLCGESIEHLSTARRIQLGLAMLTESRREDGLCMPASIAENMTLVAEPGYAHNSLGILNKAALMADITALRGAVQLNPSVDLHKPVQTLSGGNQQKVALAKWLLNHPKVLILDEPTRGIDVGAKFEIYALIDRLAAEGLSILLISSEIEELLGLCDRILVMSQGEIRDELSRQEFDQNRIMHAALQTERTTEGAS
jgi:ribose transport system ATP-binding protein